jgi:hypothetical protein
MKACEKALRRSHGPSRYADDARRALCFLIKEIELSRGSNTGNDWEIKITYGNNKLNIFNSSSRASDKPDR